MVTMTRLDDNDNDDKTDDNDKTDVSDCKDNDNGNDNDNHNDKSHSHGNQTVMKAHSHVEKKIVCIMLDSKVSHLLVSCFSSSCSVS